MRRKMKKRRKWIVFLIIMVMLTESQIFGMSFSKMPWKVEAASAKLLKKTLVLSRKASVVLKVQGTKKRVQWSSSNPRVATVKNGKVTAKKMGTATIRAKVGRETFTCKVYVKLSKVYAEKALKKFIKRKESANYYYYYDGKDGRSYTFFVTYTGPGMKMKYFVDSLTGKVYESGPFFGVNEWSPSSPKRYRFNAFHWL